MSNHAFGRGTVAVPVFWLDTLVPQARFILQAVWVRNRMRLGKPDVSGQHTVEAVLYLVSHKLHMLARVCACCLIDCNALSARLSDCNKRSFMTSCAPVLSGNTMLTNIQKPPLQTSFGIAC